MDENELAKRLDQLERDNAEVDGDEDSEGDDNEEADDDDEEPLADGDAKPTVTEAATAPAPATSNGTDA